MKTTKYFTFDKDLKVIWRLKNGKMELNRNSLFWKPSNAEPVKQFEININQAKKICPMAFPKRWNKRFN